MAFSIRPFDILTDLADITLLTNELGYPTTASQCLHRMEAILATPGYYTFVAATPDQVIGYIGIVKQLAWELDGSFIKIQALVVNKEHRKEGIGAALIQFIESFAQAQGASYIMVNSGNRPEREIAHKFYQQQGYAPKSTGFRKML